MTRQLPLTGWNALELQQPSARVGLDCNLAPPPKLNTFHRLGTLVTSVLAGGGTGG